MKKILSIGYLAHSMSDTYKRRMEKARQNICESLRISMKPYIAFSTGKDSTVLANLVWEQSPDTPAVYFDADAAFPESLESLERYSNRKEVIIFKTEPILDTIARAGGPTAHNCEARTLENQVHIPVKNLLKEYDFDGAFVGLRAEESQGRKKNLRVRGPIHFSKQYGIYSFWPIGHLTFDDVWAYILSNDIDYCALYDKQFEMGLPFEDCRLSYWAGETNHEFGRWIVLKRGWPELFNKLADRFPEVRRFT